MTNSYSVINEPPISPPEPRTDAQLVAAYAAAAFQEGRIALGEALGRLALRCHVTHLHAAASALTPGPLPIHEAVTSTGPYFEASFQPDETATMPAAAPERPTVLDNARCWQVIMHGQVEGHCHEGIYHLTAPMQGTWWQHADERLDQAHPPVPPMSAAS